jgi:hypothetical protein
MPPGVRPAPGVACLTLPGGVQYTNASLFRGEMGA